MRLVVVLVAGLDDSAGKKSGSSAPRKGENLEIKKVKNPSSTKQREKQALSRGTRNLTEVPEEKFGRRAGRGDQGPKKPATPDENRNQDVWK